jgi:diguanylate cyclase (GGDEF)-like protein
MKQILNSFSDKMTAFLSIFLSLIFSITQKNADHKTLTRHIIAINKKTSSTQIINEVAACLNNILNYRLFAFVIKKTDGVDVWLDQKMYKKPLENIILKDFSLENTKSINYLNHTFHSDEIKKKISMKNLVCHELEEGNYYSKIYMLRDKNISSFNDDLVNLLLQGCSAALSRQAKMEKLKNAALIDSLTGCYNRREFVNQLKRNIAGSARHKNDLSLFILDLDHFKKVNDTYGHLAGDKVLKTISSLLKKNMRTNDIFARYGGEEFIAILPDTDKQKAMELADRLRSKIENKIIAFKDDTIKVTASFGVAQMDQCAEMEKIIQDADTMLYKAKLAGRNIVMPGLIRIIDNQDFTPRKKISV